MRKAAERTRCLDGQSKYRKAIVDTVMTLTNEASALKRLKHCASTQTNKPRRQKSGPSTVATLVAHYRLKKLVSDP
jgi:hypothetical protein